MRKQDKGRSTKPLNQKSQYLHFERELLSTTEELDSRLETMGYAEPLTETAQLTRQIIYEEQPPEKLIEISTKGKWLIAGMIFCIIALCGIGYYFWFHMLGTTELLVKGDSVKVELGSEVVLEPAMFLDTESMNPITVSQTEMTTSLMTDSASYDYDTATHTVRSKGYGYLLKGEYPIKFKNGSIEKIVMLTIEDTTPPKITGMPVEIVIEKNARGVDLQDYFAVTDFAEVEIKTDTPLTLNKEGEYVISVQAEDASGNISSQVTTINIISSKQAQKEGDNLLTKTLKDSTPVSYETEKKIVEGKCKNIKSPTGKGGNAVAKGMFSDESEQKAYEAEKALAEAKDQKEKAEKQAKANQNNNNNNNNSKPVNQQQQSQGMPTQVLTPTPAPAPTPAPSSSGSCDMGAIQYQTLVDTSGKVLYNAYLTEAAAAADFDRIFEQANCSSLKMGIESVRNGATIKGTDTNMYYRLIIQE